MELEPVDVFNIVMNGIMSRLHIDYPEVYERYLKRWHPEDYERYKSLQASQNT